MVCADHSEHDAQLSRCPGFVTLQDIAWALSELTARGVIGPNPLPEVSE
jgi:hypothetical protein